jgi:glycogen synthase
MNVLMLGWELPPYNSGGLGVACMGLAQSITDKGVNVTFVLPKRLNVAATSFDVIYADFEEEEELIQSAYSMKGWITGRRDTDDIPPDFVKGSIKFAEKIEKIAKKYKSDIVHAHDWMTFPAGIVASKISDRPLIAHIHSTEIDRTGGHFPNKFVYEVEKQGIQKADKILSVSNLTKDIIVKHYGVPQTKIDVVYNGIDTFAPKQLTPALAALKSQGYKIILFLGRITLQKGPEYFVRAAERVLRRHDNTMFVVVGAGDMLPDMMREVANRNLLHRFIFAGFLRGEEKDRIYQSADVYIMPSVSEPFGITTLEAVANNTPVIISKQSGVSEVLEHVLKVDFWDTEEMANKILGIISYPALSRVMTVEGKKQLRSITWGKAADECVRVYKQLV